MPETPHHIDALWEEFLCGSLDDSRAEALERHLREHPQELGRRRKDAAISTSLQYLLGPATQSRRLVESVQSRLENKRAGRKSGKFQTDVMLHLQRRAARVKKTARGSNFGAWAAAACALLILGALVYFLRAEKPQHTPTITQEEPLPKIAPKSDPVARLLISSGNGTVNGASVAANTDTPVPANSRIELKPSSTARLSLPDGSTLACSEQTSVRLASLDKGTRLDLQAGRVDVTAAKQTAGNELIITTPHTKVAVVGTVYSVFASPQQTVVDVTSGAVKVGEKAPAQLGPGQQITVSDADASKVRDLKNRRIVALNAGAIEQFTDRATSRDIAGRFAELALRHFAYQRPAGDALGYAGMAWPVSLTKDETTVEMWIRPTKVTCFNADEHLAKVVFLAQEGGTEYRIGDVVIDVKDRNWVLLRGTIHAGARLHWQDPDQRKLPCDPLLVKNIALRTEIADMEFDHTPLLIWRDASK